MKFLDAVQEACQVAPRTGPEPSINYDAGMFVGGYGIVPVVNGPVPRAQQREFAMQVRDSLVKHGCKSVFVQMLEGGYAIAIRTPKTAATTNGISTAPKKAKPASRRAKKASEAQPA